MCTVNYGCGFVLNPIYRCEDRDREVGPEDGCTFGVEGDPQQSITEYDIDLSFSRLTDYEIGY